MRRLNPGTQPFTTHLGIQVRIGNDDYRLRFMPTQTDAPDGHINPDVIPSENTPYEASPALVFPQPYDCLSGGTIKPSWNVRGTNASVDPNIVPGKNLQVGTLSRLTSTSVIHAGQCSMPFEMRIEALSCFRGLLTESRHAGQEVVMEPSSGADALCAGKPGPGQPDVHWRHVSANQSSEPGSVIVRKY